eukprot:jgi/Chrzof1/2573/Cz11g20240.t1
MDSADRKDPDPQEEQYILRVQVPDLADKLRKWLREDLTLQGRAELLFEHSDRHGELVVEGVRYPVTLQDLPTVVESYKTLDDTNLVKTADIGQVLLVQEPDAAPQDVESSDGVTPPMRKARRHFRPKFTVDPAYIKQAEVDVFEILSGRAPEGWAFHDVEEEYVVDPDTGEGKWQTVGKKKPDKAHKAKAGSDTE